MSLAGPGVRAVLVGTGSHVDSLLTDVPAVEQTLHDLGRALVQQCGLTEENLLVIRDPGAPKDVLVAVREAGRQADDVLLVVYVGHGLLTRDSTLYLATAATSTLDAAIADHQAIRYSALAAAVADSRARLTIVVLDCCFSGRADPPTRHGYLLTSAAGEELALAPIGERYTAFTGAMIEFLRDGDPGAPPQLTLDHLYRYQWRAQAQRQRTTPRRQAGDLSGDLVLADNPAYIPVARRDPTAAGPPTDICPYLGFNAYTAEDERYFRGRAELTSKLVRRAAARLWEHDPLVVIGPSGAGKTSLLHAGLLPAVSRGELGVPRSSGWPQVVLRPGATPLATLAAEIAEKVGCDATTVTEHPERIAELVPDARLVIVVDQFEQLFTLCADEAERAAFVALLTKLAHDHLVVLGVRADFYGHCALFPELVSALQDTLVVGPMTVDELRAAITEPAELAGLEVSPELVDLLLREIEADGPGGYDAGRLPLLSYALQTTWGQQENRVLTADGYVRTGGIAGAVERTGETMYEAFAESERDYVRQVLLAMVLINENTRDVVHRVDVPDLLAGLTDPDVGRRVLDRLADTRLVTVDEEGAEITHEALLHSWPRLRDWINTDRDWLSTRQRIQADAHSWQNSGRDTSLLYRGANLGTARATTSQSGREQQLGTAGNEFLAAGARQARRGQLVRRGLLAVLVVLTLVAAGTAGLALTQRSAALAQRATASHERDLAVSRELATKSETNGDPTIAALLSVAAWRIWPTREARAALVQSANRSATALFYPGGIGDPAIAFTQDGRTLVASASTTVARWNAITATQLGGMPEFATNTVSAAALSPDGNTLALDLRPSNPSGVGVGELQIWNLITNRKISDRPDGSVLGNTSLAFSPDGALVAGGGQDDTVSVWRAATGVLVTQLPLGALATNGVHLTFGPNGTLAVAPNPIVTSTLAKGNVHLWKVNAPAKHPVLLADGFASATALAFDPQGTTLATADQDGVVRLWNTETGQPLGQSVADVGDEVDALAFSPDGTILAAGDMDKTVRLWQTPGWQPVGTPLTGQTGVITHLAFSPDGQTLGVSSVDGTVRLWQPFGRAATATLTGHNGEVTAVAFGAHEASQAGGQRATILASGGDDGTVRLWNTATAKPAAQPQPGPDGTRVTALTFSPNGSMIAVGDSGGNVRLSHGTDLEAGLTFRQPTTVASVAFSHDGKLLAIADVCYSGDPGCVRGGGGLWDTSTGHDLGPLPIPFDDEFGIFSIAYSPTRDVIVGTTGIADLVWWNAVTRQAMHTQVSAGQAMLVLFNPNGQTVVAVENNTNIDTFDAITGDLAAPAATTSARVRSIAVSPDGTVLAVGMANSTIQLYDTSDYQPDGDPLKTGSPVNAVAFDRTGHQLAAGLADGTVQLWDTSFAVDTVAVVCAKAGRSLTKAEWDTYVAGPAFRRVCP